MKKAYSIFDVLGPIMIGPSSSHTAGAVKLAKIAACIAGGDITNVTFYLHGSFAETYKGHGTDKALVAGILGMGTYDEHLRHSFDIAQEKGITFEFVKTDLGVVHPNTVKFEMTNLKGNITTIVGSSIGGGNVTINNVNGYELNITGEYYSIILIYKDVQGVISEISGILAQDKINISTMNVSRKSRGTEALMIIEIDDYPKEKTIDKIKELEIITSVLNINPKQ